MIIWPEDEAAVALDAHAGTDGVDVRKRVIELTHGVIGRIFRLMEAAAVEAIRNGRERIDASSFDDEGLLLPLVSMHVAASRRRATRPRAA